MSRKQLACEELIPTDSQLASLIARACNNSSVEYSVPNHVMIMGFRVLNRVPSTHFTFGFSNSPPSVYHSVHLSVYQYIYLSPLIPFLHSPSLLVTNHQRQFSRKCNAPQCTTGKFKILMNTNLHQTQSPSK